MFSDVILTSLEPIMGVGRPTETLSGHPCEPVDCIPILMGHIDRRLDVYFPKCSLFCEGTVPCGKQNPALE